MHKYQYSLVTVIDEVSSYILNNMDTDQCDRRPYWDINRHERLKLDKRFKKNFTECANISIVLNGMYNNISQNYCLYI